MTPSNAGFLNRDFEIAEQPSRTYRMDLSEGTTKGYADGLDAMRQAVFKILNTERYQYVMYSWNYGIETMDLYGGPATWACSELERRVSEALLWDARITGVTDFEYDLAAKGRIHASFTVHTVFGDVEAEKGVEI